MRDHEPTNAAAMRNDRSRDELERGERDARAERDKTAHDDEPDGELPAADDTAEHDTIPEPIVTTPADRPPPADDDDAARQGR